MSNLVVSKSPEKQLTKDAVNRDLFTTPIQSTAVESRIPDDDPQTAPPPKHGSTPGAILGPRLHTYSRVMGKLQKNPAYNCDEARHAAGVLTPHERYDLSQNLPPLERQKMVVESYLSCQKFFNSQSGKCEFCSFTADNCICAKLAEMANHFQPSESPSVRFLCWMHYKERYRASNTGKLLLKLYPGSMILVDGVDADHKAFTEIISQNTASRSMEDNIKPVLTLLLYPSADAVDAKSLILGSQDSAIPASLRRPLSSYSRVDVILLDGTWNQAGKMRKRVTDPSLGFGRENVLPVKISPTELSRFSCRRQSEPGHICTIEAAAVLLQEMDLVKAEKDPPAEGILYKALALLCGAMDVQSNKLTMKYVAPTKNGKNRLPKNTYGETVFGSTLQNEV